MLLKINDNFIELGDEKSLIWRVVGSIQVQSWVRDRVSSSSSFL